MIRIDVIGAVTLACFVTMVLIDFLSPDTTGGFASVYSSSLKFGGLIKDPTLVFEIVKILHKHPSSQSQLGLYRSRHLKGILIVLEKYGTATEASQLDCIQTKSRFLKQNHSLSLHLKVSSHTILVQHKFHHGNLLPPILGLITLATTFLPKLYSRYQLPRLISLPSRYIE